MFGLRNRFVGRGSAATVMSTSEGRANSPVVDNGEARRLETMESAVSSILRRNVENGKDIENTADYKEYAQNIEANIKGKKDPNIKKMMKHISQHIFENYDLESGDAELSDEDKIKNLAKFTLLAEPFKKILGEKTFMQEVFFDMWPKPESGEKLKKVLFGGIAALGFVAAGNTLVTSKDDIAAGLSAVGGAVIVPALLWKNLAPDKTAKELIQEANLMLLSDLAVSFIASSLFGDKAPSLKFGVGSGIAIAAGCKLIEKYAGPLLSKLGSCFTKKSTRQAAEERPDGTEERPDGTQTKDLENVIKSIMDKPEAYADPDSNEYRHMNEKFDKAFEKALGSDGTDKNENDNNNKNYIVKFMFGAVITAIKMGIAGFGQYRGYGNTTMASLVASACMGLFVMRDQAENMNVNAGDIAGAGTKPIYAAATLLPIAENPPEIIKKNLGAFLGVSAALAVGITAASRSTAPILKKFAGIFDNKDDEGNKVYDEAYRKYQRFINALSKDDAERGVVSIAEEKKDEIDPLDAMEEGQGNIGGITGIGETKDNVAYEMPRQTSPVSRLLRDIDFPI